jgi:hypothetical protein
MKTREITFALFFIVFICGLTVFVAEIQNWQKSRIPCEQLLGGWHPDFPKKYTEMCALAREMQKKNVSK